MAENIVGMWQWERHFQISAQSAAESLFNLLDPDLQPLIRLVGVAPELPEDYPAAAIVPRECELLAAAFDSVIEHSLFHAAQNPLSQMMQSHPIAQANQDAHIRAVALRDAVTQALARFDELDNHISYVGFPVQISDFGDRTHLVCISLRLQRQPIDGMSVLTQRTYSIHELRTAEIPTSLIEAAAFEYLRVCTGSLRLPQPGANLQVADREATEVLRSAGRRLMSVPEWKGSDGYAIGVLYEACNEIAAMRYEGGEAKGGFIVASADHPAVEYVAQLDKPFPIRLRKAMRKLIESSSMEMEVITDGQNAYGLGRISTAYQSIEETIFKIEFSSLGIWDLIHNDSILMRVRHGQPELIRPKIDGALLRSRLLALHVSANDIERLVELVLDTTRQSHGALLIISNDADQEALRLGTLAFRLKPVRLDLLLLQRLTIVDGAVLLDLKGHCHAFGVILDGHAKDKGDPARGARYNSAVRYVEETQNPTLAIVVSEDGYADMIFSSGEVVSES